MTNVIVKKFVKGSGVVRKNRLTIAFLLPIAIATLSGCNIQGSHDESRMQDESWTMVQEKVAVFSDGEYVNLWRSEWGNEDVYKLSDETILLTVQKTMGPGNVQMANAEGFDNLNETAQNAISAYYNDQGLLYDIQIELEKAYSGYLDCANNKTNFSAYVLSQATVPISASESIICICTSVMLPIGQQMMEEIQVGAVFDKETGEAISTWDIFTVSEAEAREQLLTLSLSQIADATVLAEMKNALKAEYILLHSDELQIYFPMGSLPSEEYSHILVIDYDDLKGIMHSWAIPNEIEQ